MGIRKSRIICMILTIIIFFSGLYFEPGASKTDLLCPYVNNTHTVILPVSQKNTENQACTSRMLGIKDTVKYIGAFYKDKGRESNPGADRDCCCPFNALFIANLFCFEYTKIIKNVYSKSDILTTFIHKSDGKKKNHMLTCL